MIQKPSLSLSILLCFLFIIFDLNGMTNRTQIVGGTEFVWIPAGEFMMGSSIGKGFKGEYPRRKVNLRGFWMTKYETTQSEYVAMMSNNPSEFKQGGARRPVDSVSWNDANNYCVRFSKKMNVKATLPTEAQWEYACRAGSTNEYYWGEYWLKDKSWNNNNSGKQTHDVGTKPANRWGLFDMAGNVWEWCMDKYDAGFYGKSPLKNPVCVKNKDGARVLRGGCWDDGGSLFRSANRSSNDPESKLYYYGFRMVLLP